MVTGILGGRPHPIYMWIYIYIHLQVQSDHPSTKAHFWVPVPWPSISKMIWHSHEVSKETWNKGFSHMTTSPLTKSLEATKMRPFVGCFSTCTSPCVSGLMKWSSMDLQIALPHFWGVSPRGHGWHSQHKWLPKTAAKSQRKKWWREQSDFQIRFQTWWCNFPSKTCNVPCKIWANFNVKWSSSLFLQLPIFLLPKKKNKKCLPTSQASLRTTFFPSWWLSSSLGYSFRDPKKWVESKFVIEKEESKGMKKNAP